MSQVSEYSFFANLDRKITAITRIFYNIGAFSVFFMMLLVTAGSFSRYLLDKPIPGGNEITSFMLIFMVFLIIGFVEVSKGNVTMGAIVDKLPARLQASIDSILYIICLAICTVTAYQTVVQGLFITQTGSYSQLLNIPIGPFYFVGAVGWVLIGLGALLHLVKAIINAVAR